MAAAAYATITRRLTSIHKLVAIAAIAAGDLDYEDPTKHPRVGVTLQAIRRRLSTDQDQATPLTSQRLLQVLLTIDTATVAGIRDVALLLVGWYAPTDRAGERHKCCDDPLKSQPLWAGLGSVLLGSTGWPGGTDG